MLTPSQVAVLGLVTVAVLVYAYLWRPSRQFVHGRKAVAGWWQGQWEPAEWPIVQDALEAITSAFLLRAGDAVLLRPKDKLIDIYRAAYPVKGMPDALEFEGLSRRMRERPGVDEEVLAGLTSMTVEDVIETWLRCCGRRRTSA